MQVIQNTGFATGLYSGTETESQSITEKAAKIAYLDKIINLVGLQLNTLVEAKSLKIVAGLDAQNTNQFLQLLAVAAKNVPDSSVAVRNVLDQLNGILFY
jgi:TRAF3-interacting protein 1